MQTQQEVESICYSNILAQAERHMGLIEPRTSGTCRDCVYCVWGTDHVDAGACLTKMLVDSVGICTESDSPCMVELDIEHDEGCWRGFDD